ncbi:MAG TPA: acetyl/propionyl-CoA carboxylase subunit alpha, partial [Thermopetrobacter sp.]|nr:acetyl/propionyl-CoA carboxylase subunit alpha [Thermopetrobacter sp.]
GVSHAVSTPWRPGLPVWQGRIDGMPVACHVQREGIGWRLMHRGVERSVLPLTERQAQLAELMPPPALADTSRRLISPMPGRVLSVVVEQGRAVKAGEPLCVVEAMKMENILRAERDAIVAAVHVAPGDLVAADQTLMEFAAPDDA